MKMTKLCFFVMVMCLICGNLLLADTLVAVDSCRTSLNDGTESEADENKSDSDKLSVRADSKAAKSWIKFDISSLDVSSLSDCKLRVTLHKSKDSTCLLSVVNDNYTTGIGWTSADLTWNTGPGNITSSDGVNPDDTNYSASDLQNNLMTDATTLVGTVDYSGGTAGDQYLIDVLSILQADTDGIVQFVLHGSGGSTDFATHTNANGSEYWPTLVYSSVPTNECEGIGTTYLKYADQSCKGELNNGTESTADDNLPDNNKLSVRSDNKAAKSWIKFDINELGIDPNRIKSATLRITSYRARSGTSSLSYVNDSCLDNIDWTESTLTWNNAPGNIQSSDGVDPDDTAYTQTDLRSNLNPDKTTYLALVDYSDGTAVGDQFTFDVMAAIQEDTDGVLQFVLHAASGLMYFATHDHASGEEYWPLLTILEGPEGADDPYPCPDEVVSSDLVGLSWTNPDPNDGVSDITCTVYLGTDPNRPDMDSVTLDPGVTSVLINESNFPDSYDEVNGGLYNNTVYYWFVDCDDPSNKVIPGLEWSFEVNNNNAPIVNAGDDQVAWLGMSGTAGQEVVALTGVTSDDGKPVPPAEYTVSWTQVDNGAPTVSITSDDEDAASVTIVERGDYEFTLSAYDGEFTSTDTVRVVVGDNPCDASHIDTSDDYDAGDINLDCIVNLEDFALLIAANWQDCTDTLMDCGN